MTKRSPDGTGQLHFDRVSLATGVSLHYADGGTKGKTPIVFVHGFVDSYWSFMRVIEFLSPAYRTIALDLRGHGDSDKPETGYSIADFTQDLILFIDALGLGKAHLVGHSMGSFIAQSFAAIHPHRVEKLVLIGSAPCAVGNPVLLEIKPLIDALEDPLERDFVSGFQAIGNPVPAEFMEMIISETMKVPARVWRSACAGLMQADLRPILHSVAAPTLIMWGNQDTIFMRRDQETLLSLIPDSRLKEFDAGHALHWEKPMEAAAALESFISG
jgi:pimeloyl-ACP methyl ester carboxylesterase